MEITKALVQELVAEQFPQWSELEIRPVSKSGHDNRTFHLGDTMTVRLPSGVAYADQVKKESRWLPWLQKQLPYAVPTPLALGKPGCGYPYFWSVNRWIAGETLLEASAVLKRDLAAELATALNVLQEIEAEDGPKGGVQNFYRGCTLAHYHQETREALRRLSDQLPTKILWKQWDAALEMPYQGKPLWVHGDIAPGNILVRQHHFYGLLDFGILGTGDPACDYAMAWTYFDRESRPVFLRGLPQDLIFRARGWALWKALITYQDSNPDFRDAARRTIEELLSESEY